MRPTPVDQLERRLPTAGRIRIGRKVTLPSGREAPDKLATFRFTSQDKASIEQVAALYGGDVQPWKDHAGQWEVYTPATMVRVILPPDPLGNTPIYELWAKGGCVRRCTGVKGMMRVSGPEGGDLVEQDCICAERGRLECTLKTRLSVLLPEVRFLGSWRLDTGSEHAAKELPGMVALFQDLHERKGLPFAELRLEERPATVWSPKRRSWVQSSVFIPMLGFDQSLDELAGPPMGALPPGPPTPPKGELEYVEAELVEEEDPIPLKAYNPDPDLVRAWKDNLSTAQQNKALRWVRDNWGAASMPPASFEEIPLEVVDVLMERHDWENG
jgi:hypothetical protein